MDGEDAGGGVEGFGDILEGGIIEGDKLTQVDCLEDEDYGADLELTTYSVFEHFFLHAYECH